MTPALQSALDASGYVGAWETDLETQTVALTGKAADLLGIEPCRATVGVPVTAFLLGIHPEDREEVAHLVHEAHGTTGRFEAEFRTIGDGRQTRFVLARGRVEAVENQGPRCVGIMVDVTESRHLDRANDQARTVRRIASALVEVRSLVDRLGSFRLRTLIDMALIELERKATASGAQERERDLLRSSRKGQ